jgi:hypothetical protein
VDFHEIKKNLRLQALQSEHLGYHEIEKQNLKSGKHASQYLDSAHSFPSKYCDVAAESRNSGATAEVNFLGNEY